MELSNRRLIVDCTFTSILGEIQKAIAKVRVLRKTTQNSGIVQCLRHTQIFLSYN